MAVNSAYNSHHRNRIAPTFPIIHSVSISIELIFTAVFAVISLKRGNMSSRTDSYLSLCLEQASKSTRMQHRHGAIIVRGGKVIGQGHNDHRPGFDGGFTLKTGKLAAGASSSPAIQALVHKNKARSKPSCLSSEPVVLHLATTESSDLGGGCSANTPFSQHSEMAAILSALSLSSHTASYGSARSSQLMQKPGSFRLPGQGKRELRLRNLNSYVEAVCGGQVSSSAAAATESAGLQRASKASVQGSQFEPSSIQSNQEGGAGVQRGGGEQRERAASSVEQCCERP